MEEYVKQKFNQFKREKGNKNKKISEFDVNAIEELEMAEIPRKPV